MKTLHPSSTIPRNSCYGEKKDFPAVELALKKASFSNVPIEMLPSEMNSRSCWYHQFFKEKSPAQKTCELLRVAIDMKDTFTDAELLTFPQLLPNLQILWKLSRSWGNVSKPISVKWEEKGIPFSFLSPFFSEFITSVEVFQAANGRLGWGCSFEPADFGGLWLRLLPMLRESHCSPCPSPLWVNTLINSRTLLHSSPHLGSLHWLPFFFFK